MGKVFKWGILTKIFLVTILLFTYILEGYSLLGVNNVVKAEEVESELTTKEFTVKSSNKNNPNLLSQQDDIIIDITLNVSDNVKGGDTYKMDIYTPAMFNGEYVRPLAISNAGAFTGISDITLEDGTVVGTLEGFTIRFNNNIEKYTDAEITFQYVGLPSPVYRVNDAVNVVSEVTYALSVNGVSIGTHKIDRVLNDLGNTLYSGNTYSLTQPDENGEIFIRSGRRMTKWLNKKGDVVRYRVTIPDEMEFRYEDITSRLGSWSMVQTIDNPLITRNTVQVVETELLPQKPYKFELVQQTKNVIEFEVTALMDIDTDNYYAIFAETTLKLNDTSIMHYSETNKRWELKSGKRVIEEISPMKSDNMEGGSNTMTAIVVAESFGSAGGELVMPPTLTAEDTVIQSNDAEFSLLNSVIAMDKIDGDIAKSVKIVNDGGFDVSKPGVYRVQYSVMNSFGLSTTYVRTITVENQEPKFETEDYIAYDLNDKNYDLVKGLTVIDPEDGGISDKIEVLNDGGFDINKPGKYTIKYRVEDSNGARVDFSREVEVQSPDTLWLTGFVVDEKYADSGWSRIVGGVRNVGEITERRVREGNLTKDLESEIKSMSDVVDGFVVDGYEDNEDYLLPGYRTVLTGAYESIGMEETIKILKEQGKGIIEGVNENKDILSLLRDRKDYTNFEQNYKEGEDYHMSVIFKGEHESEFREEKEDIPYEEERKPNTDLLPEEEKVIQEGEDGEYKVELEDVWYYGEVEETKEVDRVLSKEPVNEVVEYGVNEKPKLITEDIEVVSGTEGFNLMSGVIAEDREDGEITNRVEIVEDSNFNINLPGDYNITYRVEDSHGGVSEITRLVKVLNQAPYLEMKDVTVKFRNEEFKLTDNVIAKDFEDGDITNNIEVIDAGGYNVNEPGQYTVKYRITDAHGEVVEGSRVISVSYVKPLEFPATNGTTILPYLTIILLLGVVYYTITRRKDRLE